MMYQDHVELPDSLRTDVLTFDLHHQWFLVLMKHAKVSVAGRWGGFTDWAVQRVGSYLGVHNHCEEFAMRQFGYRDLKNHVAGHEYLVASWKACADRHRAGRLNVEDLDRFTEILIGHIGEADSAYAKYFADNNLRVRANNVLWENHVPLMTR